MGVPLRFRAVCREGCGVLHLTWHKRAADTAADAHHVGLGHATLVQVQVQDYADPRVSRR